MKNNKLARKLPPLKTLAGFEAAARLLSFRAAAEALSLTHPAISQQIAQLEENLGTKLFTKTGRKLSLTAAGERFYPVVFDAISLLSHNAESIRRTSTNSQLRVHAYVTFSIRWLAKRLPDFRKHYPDIELDVISMVNWEFDELEADVGLVYRQEPPAEHLHWTPLCRSDLFVVCSPKLISPQDHPMEIKNILNYPLLCPTGTYPLWQKWLESAGLQAQNLTSSVDVDTVAIVLEMALDGEGIALVDDANVGDYLSKGWLIKPVEHTLENYGYWGLICRKDKQDDPRITCFEQWLLQQI